MSRMLCLTYSDLQKRGKLYQWTPEVDALIRTLNIQYADCGMGFERHRQRKPYCPLLWFFIFLYPFFLFFKKKREKCRGEAVDVLNHCLAATMDWMRANKLRLNPDKTEMLLVDGFSDRMVDTYPILDGVTLPLKDRVRSLGVVLDSSLSLEAQVASVARNAFYQLRLVAQLCPYLSKEDLTSVVHALITLRLDYCNALYVGLPLKTVRKLQLVQNAAARLLTGTKRSDHITPVLARLHWLPICFRARF
ncbi:uncharacterized protein LOC133387065 isoform X2 [Rhineura floridana]|uniref:uncharacterized protein LOC133387065 isoform X2 n=1 Tax=Rhineura floridana TaxID=261503 RepID=UPI002AC80DF8|nr:uncharacterized protein LOC133387065 isoform X2 [Rhineura floridana]